MRKLFSFYYDGIYCSYINSNNSFLLLQISESIRILKINTRSNYISRYSHYFCIDKRWFYLTTTNPLSHRYSLNYIIVLRCRWKYGTSTSSRKNNHTQKLTFAYCRTVICALVFRPFPKSITKFRYFIVSKSDWTRIVKLLPDNRKESNRREIIDMTINIIFHAKLPKKNYKIIVDNYEYCSSPNMISLALFYLIKVISRIKRARRKVIDIFKHIHTFKSLWTLTEKIR